MSTATSPDPLAPDRPPETAPSAVLSDAPGLARVVGFVGLFALVLGLVVWVSNLAVGPRWMGTGWSYFLVPLGLALMLYHAARDAEVDVRRMYGALAAIWLVLAVAAALVPAPVFSSGVTKAVGGNLVPYGIGFAFLALAFAVPFVRYETNAELRSVAVIALLVVGAVLAAVGLLGPVLGTLVPPLGNVGRVFRADFLAGPGVALALLGLAFLCAYLGQVESDEGAGYWVAVGIGAAGAAVFLFALARSAAPELLYQGPNALRTAYGTLDPWKVTARLVAVAAFGGLVWWAAAGRGLPLAVRSTLGAAGAAGMAVLLVASVKANLLTVPPAPFLVPGGVMLMGLGLVFVAVGVGVCSDNQFITLTRRELASFFLSPIGYLVLGGMVLAHWISYYIYVGTLASERVLPEPIVSHYFFALIPVIVLLLEIPALTMRLVAEEWRTGSLEVLLTAPVNEAPVVLSKFLATWLFFLITWLPSGLFLVVLRVEVDQPFDYRPLLSYYVALAAQGLTFVAMGLFFSVVTRNQIVAAVLTLVGMIAFLAFYLVRVQVIPVGLPPVVQTVVGRLSFVHMWQESLAGQLPLQAVIAFASPAALFLFLSVKVLEARKWN